MPTTPTTTQDEAEIRERLTAWTRALQAKDLNALMALYAPDVVTFDLMPPHQVPDAAHYRKNFERWFASMDGPMEYEPHDLHVCVADSVALSFCKSHVTGKHANGEKADYWVRVTTEFQKVNGEWMVGHEHVSMPARM